jgi:hypothetical protein
VPAWEQHVRREQERYLDGEERLPAADDQDVRQRQLARMGNAASGVGLSELMNGNTGSAGEWFAKAVDRYRESFELAPPDSWGRPIAIVKARLLADDWSSAEVDARWTLEQGAVETVLESFEAREDYLEDLPVADTVIVLQRLAGRRNMAAELSSPLLPNPCSPADARTR